MDVTAISKGYNSEMIGVDYGFMQAPARGFPEFNGMLSVWGNYITFTPVEKLGKFNTIAKYYVGAFTLFVIVFFAFAFYGITRNSDNLFSLLTFLPFSIILFIVMLMFIKKTYKIFTGLFPSKEWDISNTEVIIYPRLRQIKIGKYYFEIFYGFEDIYKKLMDFPNYVKVG